VQRPRKLRKKMKNILKSKFAHPSICECLKPVDTPAVINDPEFSTFYHHDESSSEDAATGDVLYPYDVCLTGSTRSHWAADIATTSIVGAGESRKDAAVLPAGASHGQGHSFI